MYFIDSTRPDLLMYVRIVHTDDGQVDSRRL
jgi:hypothetical protein